MYTKKSLYVSYKLANMLFVRSQSLCPRKSFKICWLLRMQQDVCSWYIRTDVGMRIS
ncbi:hypothetical protein D3C71_1765400 [compost metagenome]